MGETESINRQFFLPVKVFFTGTSGKTIFTGKPDLPKQRFTTLTYILNIIYDKSEIIVWSNLYF